MQKAFAGRTGTGAKIGQLLASNLLVAPVQTAGESVVLYIIPSVRPARFEAFLVSMSIINGAKSVDEVIKTVKGGFFSVIRVCVWICENTGTSAIIDRLIGPFPQFRTCIYLIALSTAH
jgi:hypothetical protein